MMTIVAWAAMLSWIARFGFWPAITVSTVAGAIFLSLVTCLFLRRSLAISTLAGSFGGIVGCWLAALSRTDQPTVYVTTAAYEHMFMTSIFIAAPIVLAVILLGGLIGVGCYLMIRKSACGIVQ